MATKNLTDAVVLMGAATICIKMLPENTHQEILSIFANALEQLQANPQLAHSLYIMLRTLIQMKEEEETTNGI